MGCTGDKTYEQAVREELRRYFHGLKLSSDKEKEIKNFISQDLNKKAAALNNYQYIYREEDAKQTAEEIKRKVMERFHVGNIPLTDYKPIDGGNNNNTESNNNTTKSPDKNNNLINNKENNKENNINDKKENPNNKNRVNNNINTESNIKPEISNNNLDSLNSNSNPTNPVKNNSISNNL